MGKEIERKFLLSGANVPEPSRVEGLKQGYLDAETSSIRIRLKGEQCLLTIKSSVAGPSRMEFEYPIPMEDGLEILSALCHQPIIRKNRHLIEHAGKTWELDEFEGENVGLKLAEIEMEEENEEISLPDWVGEEVTEQERYSNAYLAKYPYTSWHLGEEDHKKS